MATGRGPAGNPRDPGGSLLAKRFLHARGDTPQVVAHRLRIERGPHGKDVPEQLHRDAERHERGPLRLQIQHLGRDVFGEQPRQRAEAAARCTLAATGLQSWTGHRYVTERRTELQRGSALAPKAPAARVAVAMVSDERRGLGADHAILNTAQQFLGLGERQADLLQLVMGLVQHQNLLVSRTVVADIDSQPDFDLHISSPHEFSGIRREESLHHACDARTWISAPGSG